MVPAFKGLGYGMIVVRFFVNIYYVIITAWALYYLCIGFQSELPWKSCEEEFNTKRCYSKSYQTKCDTELAPDNGTWYRKQCMTYDEYCAEFDGDYIVVDEKVI